MSIDPSKFVTAEMLMEEDAITNARDGLSLGLGSFGAQREREEWLKAQPRPRRSLRCWLGRHEWSDIACLPRGWYATYCVRYCGAHRDFAPMSGWSDCAGFGSADVRGDRCLAGMHWMARVPGFVTQWMEWLRYHDLMERPMPVAAPPAEALGGEA